MRPEVHLKIVKKNVNKILCFTELKTLIVTELYLMMLITLKIYKLPEVVWLAADEFAEA